MRVDCTAQPGGPRGCSHSMTIRSALLLLLLAAAPQADPPPNLVLIYADDLGYGDTGCYGATRVKTPNIDRVAREGLRFTDAHSAAGTCTPSRYAMLTGEYAWRKKGTGILPGDAALIIAPGRTTLPSVFQAAGYRTGVVGKWHLGLGDPAPDWNGELKPGPLEIGFTSAFILPATGDRTPCVYVEDHRVAGLDPKDPIQVSYGKPVGDDPTGKANPELLKFHPSHGHDMTIVNGVSRIGTMSGGKAARWVDEDMADTITGKAVQFIEKNAKERFFLYFALHDIHVPRVPHPRFANATDMGPRGNAIAEADWSVGRVLETLDRLKLSENTIVIVTSDNGPVLDDGYKDDAVTKLGDHKPAGPLRGGKSSAFEGGTRVPFLLRWPARVKPGVSDALVGQIDLLASLAPLVGRTLKDEDAPDSFDLLKALLGETREGREHLVQQGGPLSLRAGPWKYIMPGRGVARSATTGTEGGADPGGHLYNLVEDLAETKNLAKTEPERLKALAARLDQIRATPRSRP